MVYISEAISPTDLILGSKLQPNKTHSMIQVPMTLTFFLSFFILMRRIRITSDINSHVNSYILVNFFTETLSTLETNYMYNSFSIAYISFTSFENKSWYITVIFLYHKLYQKQTVEARKKKILRVWDKPPSDICVMLDHLGIIILNLPPLIYE